jgi:ATP-dependent protease ClpP protease subunit
VHFHAAGSIHSMAFPVFLGASRRTAAPTASFLIHSFDYTFEGKQSIAQIEEALLRLRADAVSYRSVVVGNTQIDADTVDKVLTAHLPPIVYHAEDAKAAGIVTEVLELNPDGRDEGSVRVWTVGW